MIDSDLRPMLARLAAELPADGYLYEPKWDGFRCLAFREGDEVDLRSRNHKPLARYFPELVEALLRLPERSFVLDGEILATKDGRFDFTSLLARLHPAATRVQRLRLETPAVLIAFDLLARRGEDLCDRPFQQRRSDLSRLLSGAAAPLFMTPLTDDRDLAHLWLREWTGHGLDGVVAKHRELPYVPGRRRMIKVKRERTADCVAAGLRWFAEPTLPSSLMLGLYDRGTLSHIGVAASFTAARQREMLQILSPLITGLDGHPWKGGFLLGGGSIGRLRGAAGRWAPEEMELDWTPLVPRLVCEVAFNQVDCGQLRHPARFVRWRPDREPHSCTIDQLESPPLSLREVAALT